MKITGTTIVALAAIAILAAVMFGVITLPQIGDQSIIPTTPTTPQTQAGMIPVTKQLKLNCVNEFGGGALVGTTDAIAIFDSDGQTALETLTLASGTVTTANTYQSGKTLWIKYYNDATIDAYNFWQVTVPQMTPQDAQALTINTITLKSREGAAYTQGLMTSMGNTLVNGSFIDTAGTSNDTGTMTYSFYTTTDNTGYPEFFDPLYNIDMKPIVWAELKGVGYSTFTLTGFDGGFEKGTTMYYYKVINPDSISKYKVANSYVHEGSGAVTFGWNCIGYANQSKTDVVTLNLSLKIYSNANYMQQYGSFGPYAETATSSLMIIFADNPYAGAQ